MVHILTAHVEPDQRYLISNYIWIFLLDQSCSVDEICRTDLLDLIPPCPTGHIPESWASTQVHLT